MIVIIYFLNQRLNVVDVCWLQASELLSLIAPEHAEAKELVQLLNQQHFMVHNTCIINLSNDPGQSYSLARVDHRLFSENCMSETQRVSQMLVWSPKSFKPQRSWQSTKTEKHEIRRKMQPVSENDW